MSVWAVMMVRDEADVIAGTIRHLFGEGIDEMVVADNGSIDGTRDVLADLAREFPILVIDDPDVAYYQSQKMSRLGQIAADAGAEWIVPVDADELWLAEDRVAEVLRDCSRRVGVVSAALFNHFRTAADPADPDPFRAMVWRAPEPAPLPKVAVRWEPGATIMQGNHGAWLPSGAHQTPAALLTVRHFPARSPEQFTRKGINGAQAYAATDLPEHEGAHWRAYGQLVATHGPGVLADVFREHWWYLSPTDAGLIHDPAPYRRWEARSTEPPAR